MEWTKNERSDRRRSIGRVPADLLSIKKFRRVVARRADQITIIQNADSRRKFEDDR